MSVTPKYRLPLKGRDGRSVALRPCMECLHRVGMGLKAISRQLRSGNGSIREYLRSVGMGAQKRRNISSVRARERREKQPWKYLETALEKKRKKTVRSVSDLPLFSPQNTVVRELMRKRDTEDYANRYANDPSFKVKELLRARMKKVIVRGFKSGSSVELCGGDGRVVRRHLEALFQPGMSWQNLGSGPGFWNIDHVKPCASFNLLDPTEQKKCFHYSNLRPLWWEENMAKSSLFDGVRHRRYRLRNVSKHENA